MGADYTRQVTPRPLSEREAAVLDFMLAIDEPSIAPLREQARTVEVIGLCTCGCATIDLKVDRTRTRPAVGVGSPVTEARHRSPLTDDTNCELLLFLDDGWLSMLEIVWYTKPIADFPPPDAFVPATMVFR